MSRHPIDAAMEADDNMLRPGAPGPDEHDDIPSLEEIERLLGQVAGDGPKKQPRWDDGSGLPTVDMEQEVRKLDAENTQSGLAKLPRDWREDWSETQTPYVDLLVSRCRKVVLANTGAKERRKLIRWCFGKTLDSGRLHATFEECCYELKVRPYVVQAMLHHQWYRHGVVLAEPLPLLAGPLHEGILTEATVYSFDLGRDVATAVWMHPSRPVLHVLEDLTKHSSNRDDADIAIASLIEAGLLGLREGRVWFTGRSIEFLESRRTSFSRSFLEAQDPPRAFGYDALTEEESAVLMGRD